MSPREVTSPSGAPAGTYKVMANSKGAKGWAKLCQSHAGVMARCYEDLTSAPFPKVPGERHHQLKANLREFWEWEVGGGSRIRYKQGDDGNPLVVYGGPAPSDTH